jgi:hypothetical protein
MYTEMSAGLAPQAVEKAGGEIRCTWYNQLNLRALLKPEKFMVLPRQAMPLKVWNASLA